MCDHNNINLVDKEDLKSSGRPILPEPLKDIDKNNRCKEIAMVDVIGHDAIKEKMKKMLVDVFENGTRRKLVDAGLPVPKGIIIYGPPGTGKTRISKACVNEYVRRNKNLRYEFVKATTLLGGSQAKASDSIHEFFDRIKKKQIAEGKEGTILVIDEFDALAGSRNSKSVVTKKKVEALLEEEFGGDDIYIIGPTNRPQDIDVAVISRFVRLYAGFPNYEDRLRLFEYYTKTIKIKDRHILLQLAEETEGWVGRDISSLCAELLIEQETKNVSLDYNDVKYHIRHNFQSYGDSMKKIREYGDWYKSFENGDE